MITDPQRIVARVDELFYLDNAFRRGFYAGFGKGSAWGRGTVTMDDALKDPRSPFARLMKHYERRLKRARNKR